MPKHDNWLESYKCMVEITSVYGYKNFLLDRFRLNKVHSYLICSPILMKNFPLILKNSLNDFSRIKREKPIAILVKVFGISDSRVIG